MNTQLEKDLDYFRTSEKLVPNSVVNIYKDFKFQKQFEGKATLLELKSKELTFIVHNESLLTKLEARVIHEDGHHLALTKSQLKRNSIYAELTAFLIGAKIKGHYYVNPDLKEMYDNLVKVVNTDLDNPTDLVELVQAYRIKYQDESEVKSLLFKHSNETIVRFIQQTGLKNWVESIWREERWLVSFDQDRFATPFTTIRKIRTLICINPKEDAQNSEILHFITKDNSTISNEDRKTSRKKAKKKKKKKSLATEEIEESIYTEEELEMMDDTILLSSFELDESFSNTYDYEDEYDT